MDVDRASPAPRRPWAERRFRAMGTGAHVVVTGRHADSILADAVSMVADLERRWSRFRPDSEISMLNRAGGPLVVSRATAQLVDRGIAAWRLTGGRFDPTMLAALDELGYDRSFEDVGPATARLSDRRRSAGCDGIVVRGDRVGLPCGTRFDPGGLGKGLAADLVTESLVGRGASGAMVNLGGDLRVRGAPPAGDRWLITVREPAWSADPIALVELADGAVATSTTLKRRWPAVDGERHHVLDPATGRPHRAGAVVATAIAAEGWWAEAAATASIGGGDVDGVPLLRVGGPGGPERRGGFERYERTTPISIGADRP